MSTPNWDRLWRSSGIQFVVFFVIACVIYGHLPGVSASADLVMGPVARGKPARFRVLIDGHPPGPAHGTDVDAQGNGTVSDQRLYQLVRQPKGVEGREFQIEFFEPGVQVLAFTFG